MPEVNVMKKVFFCVLVLTCFIPVTTNVKAMENNSSAKVCKHKEDSIECTLEQCYVDEDNSCINSDNSGIMPIDTDKIMMY